MPILLTDFPALTAELHKIFNETAARKVADNKGFQIFNVFDTNLETYKHLVLHGLSGIKRVTSGQDLPKVNARQGDTISWTQEYFGAALDVTKSMRKFDRYDEIAGLAKGLTEDSFDKVDQSLADRILNGWATSYTDVYGDTVAAIGPDAKALFAANHSTPLNSNTFSNIISDGTYTNPVFSRQAIVYQRMLGKTYRDPNNIARPINYDTIVVGPALEDEADRVCNSQLIPGSANNDKNPLYGKIKNIYVWERLSETSSGTNTSAYWFMVDSAGRAEALQCLFSERPSLDAPEQVYINKNWEYTLDYYYAIGTGFPAYIAGSKGDNS